MFYAGVVDVLRGFVVCLIIYAFIKWYTNKPKRKLPPGPKGVPLLGHVGALSHLSVWNHRDLYGGISYVNAVRTDVVCLNTIEVIREAMMSSNGVFDDRPASFMKKYVAYRDVAFCNPTDAHWRKMRKFLQTSLKGYGKGVTEIEKIVSQELETVCDIIAAKKGDRFDLQDILQPSLANVIYILLINERFPYDHGMIESVRELVDTLNYMMNPFVDMMMVACPLVRFLPFGPGRQYASHIKCKKEIMNYVFEKNKNLSPSELREKRGLAYDLIEEMRSNDLLDDDMVLGGIDDVLEGGLVSTKWGLYVFFLITINYDAIQSKVQNEIDRVVGRDRRPCVSDRRDMPYTQAVIMEVLRYATIVPIPLPHTCSRDAELRGFTVPKGSVILCNAFRVHHDPDVWRDPWTFDPSRFIDDDGNFVSATHQARKNLFVFGLGARSCLGEVLARTRMFLYVTYLLQTFTFLPDGQPPSCDPRCYAPGLIIHPAPYQLRVESR